MTESNEEKRARILGALKEQCLGFELHEHPAVFNCEEANLHLAHLDGARTKNLFLRDQKGRRHFLVTVEDSKSVDLKVLSDLLQAKRLGFASAERLQKYLGVSPGSVTLLALLNAVPEEVELVIDEDVWASSKIQCHPLENTATVLIGKEELASFIQSQGFEPQVMRIPS